MAKVVKRDIFAERLAEARVGREWSQQRLAAETGFRQSLISAWERGLAEPSCTRLAVLCAALDVSADWLIGLKD